MYSCTAVLDLVLDLVRVHEVPTAAVGKWTCTSNSVIFDMHFSTAVFLRQIGSDLDCQLSDRSCWHCCVKQ